MKKFSILIVLLWCGSAAAQTDSLAHYLNVAARNNPSLGAEFLTYKASLEKIPQAGAFADPELEMGFFLKPMDVIDGRQVADFRLMQMFPWFGTRRAARTEAMEMSRMAYEKFRQSRDNLFLTVKTQWWALASLEQQLTNVRENRILLVALKELASNRFSAPSFSSGAGGSTQSRAVVSTGNQPAATTSGMSGMGQMGASGASATSSAPMQNMGQMSSQGMGGSQGGMSDVLRIDMELNELQYQEQALSSQIVAAKAKFNALLGRDAGSPVAIPDSIVRLAPPAGSEFDNNPMIGMAEAEVAAANAAIVMNRRMGLPMIGVGLQYSIIGKRMAMGIPTTAMNGRNMIMPMASLSIPIWRGKYKAAVNESRLVSQAAEEKYRAAQSMLQAEWVSRRQELADAERKVEMYRRQEELALAAYRLAVSEFSTGKATLGSVLEVERQLLDYKTKRSEAVAACNTVIAAIENILSEPQTAYEK